jgi:ribosomal-protein-alanine N-acetyltransferase
MLSSRIATLRPARIDEAASIARMSRRHVEHGLRWRWTPARVRRSIADPDTMVLCAASRDGIAGFAIMRFGDLDAHLHLLATDPRHRRQGIATGLMRWLEKSCATAGIRRVRLEVRGSNSPAQSFYHRSGYRLVGRIPGYYDRRETALVFVKGLA